MVTIIPQLIDEFQQLFSSRTDEYKETLVKEKYKKLPKIHYPLIIVEEIENSEVSSRSTTKGEMTTALGYQITAYSRDMDAYDSIDSVRFMLDIIDKYLSTNYNMQRVGTMAVVPYISDSTIMTAANRYSCVYDKETNLLYRN